MKHGPRIGMSLTLLLVIASACLAQSVSPIITEYKEKGEGKIELSNNTLSPLVVTIQPMSFSIARDGTAIYRPLDPSIHVDLSTTSVRLEPRQDYYVFYKTRADSLPAWYTIYATFSPIQRGPGINVRIMLPHTVYLYQKESLRREDVRVGEVTYLPEKKLVVCDIENISKAYGRMREGTIQAGKDSVPVNGFPLLPGSPRVLQIPWTSSKTPEQISLHFDRFEIKLPVNQGPPSLIASAK
ncbi:MAG TPA: hypothetical protein VKB38_24985 [Terracidiphilus sp.]|nr:hypothetical protein [Terracidiphilus sp.]